MPRLQSLVPLLRPLAAPRAVACPQHLRFSTATRWQAEQRPQRAADVAAAESLTEADSAQPPEQKPTLPSKHPRADNKPTTTSSHAKNKAARKPKTPHPPKLSLPPPKYTVSRSANKNLPIYTDYKRGGNLHLTTVRKITGDISALRDELRVFLNKRNEDVKINSLTRHVVVKGHHTSEIAEFLNARGM